MSHVHSGKIKNSGYPVCVYTPPSPDLIEGDNEIDDCVDNYIDLAGAIVREAVDDYIHARVLLDEIERNTERIQHIRARRKDLVEEIRKHRKGSVEYKKLRSAIESANEQLFKPEETVREVLEFFKSEWFHTLVEENIDSEQLIAYCDKEVADRLKNGGKAV